MPPFYTPPCTLHYMRNGVTPHPWTWWRHYASYMPSAVHELAMYKTFLKHQQYLPLFFSVAGLFARALAHAQHWAGTKYGQKAHVPAASLSLSLAGGMRRDRQAVVGSSCRSFYYLPAYLHRQDLYTTTYLPSLPFHPVACLLVRLPSACLPV